MLFGLELEWNQREKNKGSENEQTLWIDPVGRVVAEERRLDVPQDARSIMSVRDENMSAA